MHTLEIIAISAVTTAVAFHAFRFIGAKLSQMGGDGVVSKIGRGTLGVFTFDRGSI